MENSYNTSLFESNDTYLVHHYKTKDEWIKARHTLNGIGGSDVSAIIGENPYKTNEQLYREKLGLLKTEDISNKPAIRYGTVAENHLRRIFELDFEDKYEVQYLDNTILQNKKHPMLLYSPDGLLIDKETGEKGILEIKTTTILQSMQREKWKDDNVPQNYYCQVLHGLNVTGFDFVVLRALIRYSSDYAQVRTYYFKKNDRLDDLDYLKTEVIKFFINHIVTKTPPNLIIKL